MASINISVPHNLTKEEVANRTKNLLTTLKEKFKGMVDNTTEEWNGDTAHFSLSAKGFEVAGTMTIKDNSVDIEAKIPMTLAFFKGTIESTIQKTLEDVLK
ncbi:MAG: polyhydroxyalkanoic acid system family protein [Bacteroidetes bacterium]|nr:polyhydroxyalkanoic acid system family protein [Bacteroidota bacterium]MBS1650313.1 polyhydroxyalkanoic acid system family protein [Bacteroidota bacterium]